ncbi:MAG TPA: SPOR domain-containing protein [Flavobacteriales bacterium]|nr:SPOR domain-containing protein [Flavobacteriales bacterium]
MRVWLISILLVLWSVHNGYSQTSAADTTGLADLEKEFEEDTTEKPYFEPTFKPTFGLGVGNFTFFGDVGNSYKGFHSLVSRIGYELKVNHSLTNSIDLGFYVIFGKMSANERDGVRNLNFESSIRTGGAILQYNFSHLLAIEHDVEPYIFAGFESFEFLSKTDLYDKFGNRYYYWSDGSIRNMDESNPNAVNSILIQRDYTYESDLREQNLDGFGKYRERSWAVPVGLGIQFKIGKRMNFKVGTSMHFTFTDLVDNISEESVGNRQGNAKNDRFMYSSFSLNYDLVGPDKVKKKTGTTEEDPDDGDYYVMDMTDLDKDGVRDFKDNCLNTPEGVKVDSKGCPLDKDGDGVPDYADEENPTKRGNFVDEKGVTLTDEYFANQYLKFIDSTGVYWGGYSKIDREEVGDGSFVTNSGVLKPKQGLTYYVIVDSEKKQINANELYKYLSYKDFRQIETGDTIYYVIGNYKTIGEAIAAKEKIEKEGLKTNGVGQTNNTDNTNTNLTPEQIAAQLEKEKKDSIANTTNPGKQDVVFRVQLGAYDKKLSSKVFKDVPDLLTVPGPDNITRYYSGSFSTIEEAASRKIDMQGKGFESAFIVAYKGEKRIPLNEAGAHMVNENDKDNINENDVNLTKVDPEKVKFKVQLGAFKNDIPSYLLDVFLDLGNVQLKRTDNGLTIYLTGNESSYESAEVLKAQLVAKGVKDAFVVGEYNGTVIPAADAITLKKGTR